MPLRRRLTNTPAMRARSLFERRLLLDHRGEDQRLVGCRSGRSGARCCPGRGERALHGVVGERQDRRVRGVARRSGRCRGRTAPSGAHARVAERRHDLRRALAARACASRRGCGVEGVEEVREGRALDDRELLEHHLAFREQREDLRSGSRARGSRRCRPATRTLQSPRSAQVPLDRARRCAASPRACRPREHGAQARARVDLDARRALAAGPGASNCVLRATDIRRRAAASARSSEHEERQRARARPAAPRGPSCAVTQGQLRLVRRSGRELRLQARA